jgi:ferrous iron transport protein A
MSAQLSALQMSDQMGHLALLKKGDSATITGLAASTSADQLAVKMRLLELGFAPGVKVRVVAESFPRRDPMAVRLGNTTFALRRHEAAMIHITRADLNAVTTID